jgi:hypothetical protein
MFNGMKPATYHYVIGKSAHFPIIVASSLKSNPLLVAASPLSAVLFAWFDLLASHDLLVAMVGIGGGVPKAKDSLEMNFKDRPDDFIVVKLDYRTIIVTV